MPYAARSIATLRLSGELLDPAEISARLGTKPTGSHCKGDVVRTTSGHEVTRMFGLWRLETTRCAPESLDRQIGDVLSKLTQDLETWRALTTTYKVDLCCDLFMDDANEGLELSTGCLAALADRGIKLGLDFYAPSRVVSVDEACPCGTGDRYGACCAPSAAY
jgi:hypothetical protein